MEKTRLRKDFFRRIAMWLLLVPKKDYGIFPPPSLSLGEIARTDFYKECLVKWATVVELAEKNPQSYFNCWTYEYIDKELKYDMGKKKQYWKSSAGELEDLMMDCFFDFESSDCGFNGLEWDYSPCPKMFLKEQNPIALLLLGHDFIEPLPEQGCYCPRYKEHWNDGVKKLLTENGIRSSLKSMADPKTGFIRNRNGDPYCKGNLYTTTSKW